MEYGVYVAPLTTIFTPPTTCFQHFYYTDPAQADPDLGIATDSGCYPPGFATAYANASISSEVFDGYFSPGVCPSGYTTGCTDDYLSTSESGYLCCPSNYGCYGNIDLAASCTSMLFTETVATNVTNATLTTIVQLSPGQTPLTIWALPIRIRWHSGDLSMLQTAQTSTPPSPGTSGSAGMPVNTGLTSDTADHASGGLPTRTKIAISVVIPVVVITILVMAIFFLLRRRKKRAAETSGPAAPELDAEYNTKSELHTQNTIPVYQELDSAKNVFAVTSELDADPTLASINKEIEVIGQHNSSSQAPVKTRDSEPPDHRPLTEIVDPQILPVGVQGMHLPTMLVKRKPLASSSIASGSHLGARKQDGSVNDAMDRDTISLQQEQEKIRERQERLQELEILEQEKSRIEQRTQSTEKPT